MIWNAFLLAVRQIWRNPMRSLLTVLGVVIGVAAVITMVTIGNGASEAIRSEIESFGNNQLMLRPGMRLGPGQRIGAPSFKMEDVTALQTQLAGVVAVAPQVSKSVTLVANGRNWQTSITGTTSNYFTIDNRTFADGRDFEESEEMAGSAVCVIGSVLAMNGTIEFGVIISFILYVRLFTSPLTQIAQGMTNMQTASASAHRIFDFLESEELSDESGKTEQIEQVRGAVEFDHVRFSYPDSPDKIIIKDFSAKVQPGQKVAIVGPTGAGKTTMVNLLMRFFEVNSGSIRIDGVPTSELRREDVHKLFGMVLQDTWLFEGTVRENLVYNMEGITEEQLETVCRACGLDKFIHTLPNGFDTILSEATSISAGQKQLLTIARAMLQNAPMLILDEATSSVDTRTELLIQRAMDRLTEGRTSFVIAHRLSTIKNADLILVMQGGDVIESGTHDQLMNKGGFYAGLYNSQFEQAS